MELTFDLILISASGVFCLLAIWSPETVEPLVDWVFDLFDE